MTQESKDWFDYLADYKEDRFISCQTCHKPVGNNSEAKSGKCYDCAKACGTLRIIQQTEDSRAFDAYCGETRCRIYADTLEDALSEAKHWAAYRRFAYQSIETVEIREGYGSRIRVPGYTDCTEWIAYDEDEEA